MDDNQSVLVKVKPEDAGMRLDAYLASQIEGWSRARLQHLIENEDVLVNRHAAKSSQRVKAGDEIDVDLIASPVTSFTPEPIALDIVYEDSEIVVVNKPAGLVVHPAAGVHGGTLANGLAYHFQQLSNYSGALRPGIVHRLDKNTSGLLVVAKNETAHERLAAQFRAREVFKSYVAVVHGIVQQDKGQIDRPIGRDHRNRTRMAVVEGGRSALSLYQVTRRYDSLTLLDVELKTGRTHQIRVHLASVNHPVVGDEVYGGGRDNTVRDPRLRARIRKLSRQVLHAEKLRFHHPTSAEILEFKAPLPVELAEFIKSLE